MTSRAVLASPLSSHISLITQSTLPVSARAWQCSQTQKSVEAACSPLGFWTTNFTSSVYVSLLSSWMQPFFPYLKLLIFPDNSRKSFTTWHWKVTYLLWASVSWTVREGLNKFLSITRVFESLCSLSLTQTSGHSSSCRWAGWFCYLSGWLCRWFPSQAWSHWWGVYTTAFDWVSAYSYVCTHILLIFLVTHPSKNNTKLFLRMLEEVMRCS